MDDQSNLPAKGVLVKTKTAEPTRNEQETYFSFRLVADDNLTYLFELPKDATYLFTRNEFLRYIKRRHNAASRSLFETGDLHLFLIGKPLVIVKLSFEGIENVVYLPMQLLRNALKRNIGKETEQKKGIVQKILDKVRGK